MRTSRDSEEHRNFIITELSNGRLRQGWGYSSVQDLRLVAKKVTNAEILSSEELDAWRHHRFLGQELDVISDPMRDGDLVLVPNIPSDGSFALCRLCGAYEYEISEHGDFGHMRPVKLIKMGIANEHQLVDAGLRRSLRCRSRLWSLDAYCSNLKMIEASRSRDMSAGHSHLERAQSIISEVLNKKIDDMASELSNSLPRSLMSAEWEPVLQQALTPLYKNIDVVHTGGAHEKGADLEIRLPNPFNPEKSWGIVVQLKDYEGEISEGVADQLKEAFTKRKDGDLDIIQVVLASTGGNPSPGLRQKMEQLTKEFGRPFVYVGGNDLLKIITKGFVSLAQ